MEVQSSIQRNPPAATCTPEEQVESTNSGAKSGEELLRRDPIRQMSLQEHQRQQASHADSEPETGTVSIPEEREAQEVQDPQHASPSRGPSSFLQTQQSPQQYRQPPFPVFSQPLQQQAYFIVDPTTGGPLNIQNMQFPHPPPLVFATPVLPYPTASGPPIQMPPPPPQYTPIQPEGIELNQYDFMGVPVSTQSAPMNRVKEVLVRRYMREFQRPITRAGERLVRRMVDMDIDKDRQWLEAVVWRGANEEELLLYAEMKLAAL